MNLNTGYRNRLKKDPDEPVPAQIIFETPTTSTRGTGAEAFCPNTTLYDHVFGRVQTRLAEEGVSPESVRPAPARGRAYVELSARQAAAIAEMEGVSLVAEDYRTPPRSSDEVREVSEAVLRTHGALERTPEA